MKATPAQIEARRIVFLMRKYLRIETAAVKEARERWRMTRSSWASTPDQPTPKEYR